MTGAKSTLAYMFWILGNKLFIRLWYKLTICGKQSIEKTVEFAIAYEADVADLHRIIRFRWTGLPKSMSVRRMFD